MNRIPQSGCRPRSELLGAFQAAIATWVLLIAPIQGLAETGDATPVGRTPEGRIPAAQRDWQPIDRCSQKDCSAYSLCGGHYVEPDWLVTKAAAVPEKIDAEANSGEQRADGDFVLTGNVTISQGTRRIETGTAILNQEQDTLRLEGGVTIREPGLLMTGSKGEGKLSTREATLSDASFLIHANRLRGDAMTLDHRADGEVVISQGSFTRCEPGNDSWRLVGKRIDLDRAEGFGTAHSMTLRVRRLPIAYFPYLKFPIDDQRHSGFLTPSISFDTTGGADLSLPYYFNIAPQRDATWSPRVIGHRGLVNEGQVRFLTAHSTNEINAAFIYHDQLYDDRATIDRTGATAEYTERFQPRNRWALNIRHTGGWTRRWQTTLRFNALSDTEYLHDIGADVDAVAREQFLSRIDQSVGNRRSVALDRLAEATYQGDHWQTRIRLQGFQNLFDEGFEQYQRLPQVRVLYDRYRGGLHYRMEGEYAYFTRDNAELTGEDRVIGNRWSADGNIAYPIRWRWGFLTPSAALKSRSYDLQDTPDGSDAHPSFAVPQFSLDSGIYLDRAVEAGSGGMIQTLEPRLYYLYSRAEAQNDLPDFDGNELTPNYQQLFRSDRFVGKDRVGDAQQVSAGITTRFIEKATGAQRFRASLGQIYYFRDRTVLLPPALSGVDPSASESSLFGEFAWVLARAWHIEGALEWNPGSRRTGRTHFTLAFRPDDGQIVNVSYYFTDRDTHALPLYENVEESDLSLVWPVASRWSLVGRWNFDWNRNQTIESLFGAEYRNCCWRSRLVVRRYLKDPRTLTVLLEDPAMPGEVIREYRTDQRSATAVFFEIQFRGLATFGRKLNALLNDGIVGYAQREERIGF